MLSRLSQLCHPATLVLLVGLGGVAATACSSDNPKLMVTGIDPSQGDPEGGTYVRIRGNRFTADGPRSAKVYFGGRQGNVARYESDNVLVVEAPGGKPSEVVDVLIIFDPGGQLKIPGGFHYKDHVATPATVDDLTGAKPGSAKK